MRLMIFTAAHRLNGSGTFALRLAERARGLGHEPILVGKVFARGPAPLTELGAEADRLGLPFRLLQQRFSFDPGLLGQMELLFVRLKPTVFVSQDLVGMALYRMGRWRPPAWLAVYRGFPNPLEVEARGEAAGRGLGGALRRRLELNGLARAGEVYAASPAIAAELAGRTWAKKTLRSLGAPDAGTQPGAEEREPARQAGAAAPIPDADLDRLIASAARLAAAAPRV